MSNFPSFSAPARAGAMPGMAPMAVGQLVASIAHEVDQPLAAISLHAQAALRCIERTQSPAGAEAALRAVLEASAHASDILRSMRTLAGQAQAARSHCDLGTVLDEVLSIYAQALEKLGVVPAIAIGRQARSVWASPVQLRQLLRNLVGNAIDALSEVPCSRRALRIAARLDGAGMLVLTVRDSGAGMDASQARQAFEPMFTTKPQGMGLGLAICGAIVDAHGGRIWAESLPGRGCTAAVALPHHGARSAATIHLNAKETEIG